MSDSGFYLRRVRVIAERMVNLDFLKDEIDVGDYGEVENIASIVSRGPVK